MVTLPMDVLLLIRRYLRTRRIALVATLFVAVAVGAMIVVTAAMDGFRARIHANVRGVEPDLTIRMKTPAHLHFKQVEEELKPDLVANGGSIVALAPRLVTVGFLKSDITSGGGSATVREGVKILGVDWSREKNVIPFDRIIHELDDFYLESDVDWCEGDRDPFTDTAVPGVVVGRVVGGKLGLTTKANTGTMRTNSATVITGRVVPDPNHPGQWTIEPANLGLKVAAAFDSGRDDFDSVHIFMDRWHLHEFRFGPTSQRPDCTTVHARLTEAARADITAVASDLRARHPNLEVLTWIERNQSLMDALDVEKGAMTIVLGFIVLLTVCLIFGLLYMLVLEKTRDVGVLRSMGFQGRKVVLLFLGYGTVLGVIGSTLGAIFGVYLVENLNEVLGWLGIEVFNPAVPYRFRGIPTVLDPTQVAVISCGTALVVMIAGAVAAWKAAVVDPVRCLRYE